MNLRLSVWVTSDCNLSCRLCNQKYVMEQNKGYQMPQKEIDDIISSCKRRGVFFDIISFTGGEPALWGNLEYGVRRFREICREVTLVTNGINPRRVIDLNLPFWTVSSSQATKEQLKIYEPHSDRIGYNNHEHKPLPTTPIDGVLPADCCVSVDGKKRRQNQISYLRGRVYYCCSAFSLSDIVGMSDDIVCDFGDDFIKKYSNKDYNKEICAVCLCNRRVWSLIG